MTTTVTVTTGSQLQAARQARKLTLTQVTDATKIQPWVLEALEGDRLQDMMSPIYVKGFLATYARFLHLAPEPLLAQLPWPKPDPVLEDLPPATPAKPLTLPTIPLPVLKRLGTGLVVAAAAAGLIAVNPLQHLSKISLPKLSLPKIAKASEKKAAPKRAAQKVASTKPAAAKPAAAAVQVQIAKSTAASKLSEPVVSPAAPKLASVTPVAEPVQLPAPAPLSVVSAQPLELAVTANRTTWIKVRADGKLLTQQRLPRGANERWTAKKQFELIISKPTEVELTLNGQPISPFAVAHRGRLLITHQGVVRLPEPD